MCPLLGVSAQGGSTVFGIGRREHVTIIYPKLTLHVTHCVAVVPELRDFMSVLSVKC